MSRFANDIRDGPAHDIAQALRDMIIHGSKSMPRSQQQALGPSEVGHPCARKLAYGLMSEPGEGGYDDPLASLIGTAFHSWLEWAAEQDNLRLGRQRWLTERKVEVRPGLSGTADLFDTDTGTVIDHKCPGKSRFDHYTRHGPSNVYRAQAHLYGAGYVRLGFDVKNVAIHLIPRASAQLRSTHVWMEPYNQQLVDEILGRIDNVTLLIEALDLEHNPQNYKLIPIAPDEDCRLCSWWSPNPDPANPFHCAGGAAQEPPDLFG